MTFLKLSFGVLFFLLGWVYLYKPNFVVALNRIARDIFFNDRIVLLERKKLAILFFCLSFVALYMGVSSQTVLRENENTQSWILEIGKYRMYLAMQDYCAGRYQNALQRYQQILQANPNNTAVLKRIAYTYSAMGDKKKASAFWRKALRLKPKDAEIKAELLKCDPAALPQERRPQ